MRISISVDFTEATLTLDKIILNNKLEMDSDAPSMFSLEDTANMVKSISGEAVKSVNKVTETTAEGVKTAAAGASKSINDIVKDVDWGLVGVTLFTVAVFTWAGWTFYEQNFINKPKVTGGDGTKSMKQ